MVSGTHTIPISLGSHSYGSGVGVVWEAYHKGVPLLGVAENPIETWLAGKWTMSRCISYRKWGVFKIAMLVYWAGYS